MSFFKSSFFEILRESLFPVIIGLLTIISGFWFAIKSVEYRKNVDKEFNTTRTDLGEKSEQIILALSKTDTLQKLVEKQKTELDTQEEITKLIKDEHERQKTYNQNLRQLDQLALGVRNGKRPAFNDFEMLEQKLKKERIYGDYISEHKNGFQNLWDAEIDSETNLYLFMDLQNRKQSKWAVEDLFFSLQIVGVGEKINRLAVIDEIVRHKHTYMIGELVEIATSNYDLTLSINAAKAINSLTSNAPYSVRNVPFTPRKMLKIDAPNFSKIKRWWDEIGVKEKSFHCDFESIITKDRSKYSNDPYKISETERIKEIEDVIKEYPRLARTKAELAYLKLNSTQSFQEVKELVEESMSEADNLAINYLLLAYMYRLENDIDNFRRTLKNALDNCDLSSINSTLMMNDKFEPIKRDAYSALGQYVKTITVEY